jgi:hypothetical protein
VINSFLTRHIPHRFNLAANALLCVVDNKKTSGSNNAEGRILRRLKSGLAAIQGAVAANSLS